MEYSIISISLYDKITIDIVIFLIFINFVVPIV